MAHSAAAPAVIGHGKLLEFWNRDGRCYCVGRFRRSSHTTGRRSCWELSFRVEDLFLDKVVFNFVGDIKRRLGSGFPLAIQSVVGFQGQSSLVRTSQHGIDKD